jgi:glutaredoxin
MRLRILTIVLAILLFADAGYAQTIFKSTGPDGSIVYSDHPPADGKIERTFDFVELPSSPVPDQLVTANAGVKRKPTAVAHPVATGGVLMYSATWCGYCRRAKAYLANKGIAYTNVDIDTADGREAFNLAGSGGVPLLVVGSRRIRGFSPAGYDSFFSGR